MERQERLRLIARYADGPAEVEKSLAGIPDDMLTAHPVPGKWSAAEIIHHLADSETTSAIRVRRLLVEVFPVIPGYDQARFADVLRYNERPIGPALEAFRAARASTAPLLLLLSESDWTRPGWHTEGGLYTPETWLEIYAEHAHGHAAQLRRIRDALLT